MRTILPMLFLTLNFYLLPSAEAHNLSEGQIFQVLLQANQTNIHISHQVSQEADIVPVKSYAQRIVEDSKTALATIKEEMQKNKISPQNTSSGQDIFKESRQTMQRLEKLSGKALGKTYLKYEIQFHKKFLQLLNEELKPQVQTKYLKAILDNIESRFSDHLENAEELIKQLEARR